MTSAIETNRFKAKCASGKTYTVIEKTKEIKEPRGQNEQTFILVQKSYFLSTGEKVNKLSEKGYLIINEKKKINRKDPIIPKQFFTDIKTLFDGLKNLALCIAMILALPQLQEITAIFNDNHEFIAFANFMASAVIVILCAFNLFWLFSSMESKPKYRRFNIFCTSLLVLIIVTVVGCAAFITHPKLIF